jgi:hypothetical protein
MKENFTPEQSDDSKQNSNARTNVGIDLSDFFTQEFLESWQPPNPEIVWESHSGQLVCRCGKPLVEFESLKNKS